MNYLITILAGITALVLGQIGIYVWVPRKHRAHTSWMFTKSSLCGVAFCLVFFFVQASAMTKPAITSIARLRDIGDRVLELRRERGWTQQQLADKAGVTQPAITQLEGRYMNISIETLVRLADALQVDVNVLLGR